MEVSALQVLPVALPALVASGLLALAPELFRRPDRRPRYLTDS